MSCVHPQDLLDARRRRSASVGLVIRPRQRQPAVAAVAEEPSPEVATPDTPERLTPTRILYLRTSQGQQGVLQLHRVLGPNNTSVMPMA